MNTRMIWFAVVASAAATSSPANCDASEATCRAKEASQATGAAVITKGQYLLQKLVEEASKMQEEEEKEEEEEERGGGGGESGETDDHNGSVPDDNVHYDDDADDMSGDYHEEDDDGDGPSLIEGSSGVCNRACDATVRYLPLHADPTNMQLMYYTDPTMPGIYDYKPGRIRALLIFHGVGRNPGTYFCYVRNALMASGREVSKYLIYSIGLMNWDKVLADTHRRRRRHMIRNRAMYWSSNVNWMYGKNDEDQATSFQVIDMVTAALQVRKYNQDLKEILFVGHGGGAQFVTRYAVGTDLSSTDDLKLVWIVANPSTFLYLTPERPILVDSIASIKANDCAAFNAKNYEMGRYKFEIPKNPQEFWLKNMSMHGGKTYRVDDCSKYDEYEYGLVGMNGDYFPEPEALRKRFQDRHVVYITAYHDSCNLFLQEDMLPRLAGYSCGYCCYHVVDTPTPRDAQEENDFSWKRKHRADHHDDPSAVCDYNSHEVKYPLTSKCEAMMQGTTRAERAWAYRDYIDHLYGVGNHSQFFYPVNGIHSSCEIFQRESGYKVLFDPVMLSHLEAQKRIEIKDSYYYTTQYKDTYYYYYDIQADGSVEYTRAVRFHDDEGLHHDEGGGDSYDYDAEEGAEDDDRRDDDRRDEGGGDSYDYDDEERAEDDDRRDD